MPPKPKGKGDQEDFSDVPTLPKVKIFKFALLLKQFYVKETRDKVQKLLQQNLAQVSGQKVKPLTREEIVQYGTGKQIIMTQDAINLLPADDPRKLMTEEDMLARSAADKLFEMTVGVRRERKEKIAKIEAEIAALTAQGKDTSHLSVESENADGMFQMIDYPASKKEALAFSKYGHSMNCVFEIEEVPADEEAEESDPLRKVYFYPEPERQGAADEGPEAAKAKTLGVALREAKFVCGAKSSLRQLAFVKVPFKDRREVVQTLDKDGAVQEKTKTPEESFVGQLYQKYIDKYNQYYFQYLKFRKRVTTEPLMPDPVLLKQIRRLEHEGLEIAQYLEESAHQMEEGMSAVEKSKSSVSQDEAQKLQASLNEAKTSFEKQKAELQMRNKQRHAELMQLRAGLKVSLDDEKDYSKFRTDAYQADFIPNPEQANNIASVLSAMVTQIEANNSKPWDQQDHQSMEVETQDETLDDIFNHFSHAISCDLKLKDRGPDPSPDLGRSDTISSKFNFGSAAKFQLFDESDKTKEVTQTLPVRLIENEGDRASTIADRQQEILRNLNLPGKDRHLMPTIPAKSQRLRDQENPGLYPFCTLPIADAERMMMLKQLQQLVKLNFIDNGVNSDQRHNKFKVFERSFQNFMKPDIFRQVFNTAMLDKPDMASLYYPRNDQLLVALFNRANGRDPADQQPQEVDAPEFYLGDDCDGEQKWQASYRVMPDFQNWIAFFADEVLDHQEVAVPLESEDKPEPVKEAPKGKQAAQAPKEEDTKPPLTINVTKYMIDEEMLPERMLSIEDDKVQSIQEHSASLYPDDNSVMRVDHFTVGGNFFSKAFVQKDNFRFGLRQKETTEDVQAEGSAEEDDTENGLVSYKPAGDSEFWLHFENGTKLAVEQVMVKRCPQKTIRIDPPIPTPEEITQKEEAIKQWQAAVTKAQSKKQPIPSMDDFNIPKTPQPRWETKPMNFLDDLFTDDVLERAQSLATVTLKNGLIVQYLGSGHVMQTHEKEAIGKDLGPHDEVRRVVSADGVVIRQLKNRDAEVLFGDGVKAEFNKKRLEWIITNNLGKRRSFRDGVEEDMEHVPTAVETDQNTGAKMMIREDGVITVQFADGSVFCQHKDGTKMHTTNAGEVRIEKKTFASQTIRLYDKNYPEDVSEHFRSVRQRAVDGVVLETYLPDGSMTQTFRDVIFNKKDEEQERYRHMIKRSDLSVVIVDSSGHISLITSNARSALNENGKKARLGPEDKDVDYLVELARKPGQYTPMVYQAFISAKEGKSKIKTKNFRDNTVFELTSDHTLHKRTDAHVISSPQQKTRKRRNPNSPPEATEQSSKFRGDMELEETGQWDEPYERFFNYPRFFVVSGDGSAKELLSSAQLEYAMRVKKVQSDQSIKQKLHDVVNNVNMANHYFLTKVINMNQIEIESTKLDSIEMPSNAANILPKPVEMPELQLQIPLQEQYLFQQIFQMPPCDMFSQQAFANDYLRYQEWLMQQVRYDSEFAIVHKIGGKDGIDPQQLEDDLYFNKRIRKHILKHRAQPRQEFKPEEFKQQALKEMAQSTDVQMFRQSSMNKSIGSRASRTLSGDRNQEINVKSNLASHTGRKSITSDDITEEDLTSRLQTERLKKKATNVKKLFAEINNARRKMKDVPNFVPHYFESHHALPFCKDHPLTRPSEEVIRRMQQRIERSKHPEGNSQKGSQSQLGHQGDALDDKNNPIVALEPDELKQGSNFFGSKRGQSTSMEKSVERDGKAAETGPLPSLYLQEKIYLYNKDQEQMLKAEEHHIVKTKDFNVLGRLREERPFVKSIAKSKASSELNEKFITTECITDRRVKISSMAPRFYMNAPSVEDVRKQGQHQMILSAINKKQTFAELINQANSMVTGVLHDSLKRSLNIMPSFVEFGALRPGTVNEVTLTVKNEDSIGHRITVKPVKDNRIAVQQQEYGIIAPGMTKKIMIVIRVAEDEPTPAIIKETIKILSKHDVFTIPLSANLLSEQTFEEENKQKLEQTGKPIQNSRVRERLIRAMAESRQGERNSDGPEILTRKPKDKRDRSREDSIGAVSGKQSKANVSHL